MNTNRLEYRKKLESSLETMERRIDNLEKRFEHAKIESKTTFRDGAWNELESSYERARSHLAKAS